MAASRSLQEELKAVMRRSAQGVTVVCTRHQERLFGLTVSSFTSVSLEPPLILVSVSKKTYSHSYLADSVRFSVSVLADDQAKVASVFSGRAGDPANKFKEVPFVMGPEGSPLISGALCWIECMRWRVYDGGDHSLILGQVLAASVQRLASPLVFSEGRYGTVAPMVMAASEETEFPDWLV